MHYECFYCPHFFMKEVISSVLIKADKTLSCFKVFYFFDHMKYQLKKSLNQAVYINLKKKFKAAFVNEYKLYLVINRQ